MTFGSSPRVRGTLHSIADALAEFRFIPACAGNAGRPGGFLGSSPVHPRVCGERSCTIKITCRYPGSSPRVRGTPRNRPAHILNHRFIPACAGNARDHGIAM